MQQPSQIRIVEVSPRDGLQNEPEHTSTEFRVKLANILHRSSRNELRLTKQLSIAELLLTNRNSLTEPLTGRVAGMMVDEGVNCIEIKFLSSFRFE